MVTVIYSNRALDEINALAEFLEANSPVAARLFVDLIFGKVELLKQFPLSGRMVPELVDESVRELVVKQYRIFYEVLSSQKIAVLSVQLSTRSFQDLK